MIIYRAANYPAGHCFRDELLSEMFKINPAKDCPILWEVECKKYVKKANEELPLNGDEEDGEGEAVMVYDIEDQSGLNQLSKPSKEDFKGHLKKCARNVMSNLLAGGATSDTLDKFKSGASAAMEKISANYDNSEVFMGRDMNDAAMHVLITLREDGVTPFATLWKHGLKGIAI